MVAQDALLIGGYHLLGVVSGYYFEDSNFKLEISATVQGEMHANSGIAMIVPADFLKAILDGAELTGGRDAYISRHLHSKEK